MRCLFQEGILRGLSDSLSSSKVRLVLLLLNDQTSNKFYCGHGQQDQLKIPNICIIYTDFESKNWPLYYLKRGVHYKQTRSLCFMHQVKMYINFSVVLHGKIMTDETRIWTQGPLISSQVIYNMSYLAPVIDWSNHHIPLS